VVRKGRIWGGVLIEKGKEGGREWERTLKDLGKRNKRGEGGEGGRSGRVGEEVTRKMRIETWGGRRWWGFGDREKKEVGGKSR